MDRFVQERVSKANMSQGVTPPGPEAYLRRGSPGLVNQALFEEFPRAPSPIPIMDDKDAGTLLWESLAAGTLPLISPDVHRASRTQVADGLTPMPHARQGFDPFPWSQTLPQYQYQTQF